MQAHLAPIVRSTASNVAYSIVLTGCNQFYGAAQYSLDSLWPKNTKIDLLGVDTYDKLGVVKDGKEQTKATDWQRTTSVRSGAGPRRRASPGASPRPATPTRLRTVDPQWVSRTYNELKSYGGVAFTYFNTNLNSAATGRSRPTRSRAVRGRHAGQADALSRLPRPAALTGGGIVTERLIDTYVSSVQALWPGIPEPRLRPESRLRPFPGADVRRGRVRRPAERRAHRGCWSRPTTRRPPHGRCSASAPRCRPADTVKRLGVSGLLRARAGRALPRPDHREPSVPDRCAPTSATSSASRSTSASGSARPAPTASRCSRSSTARGRSLAFVKIGGTEVTEALVRAEAASLERLGKADLPARARGASRCCTSAPGRARRWSR